MCSLPCLRAACGVPNTTEYRNPRIKEMHIVELPRIVPFRNVMRSVPEALRSLPEPIAYLCWRIACESLVPSAQANAIHHQARRSQFGRGRRRPAHKRTEVSSMPEASSNQASDRCEYAGRRLYAPRSQSCDMKACFMCATIGRISVRGNVGGVLPVSTIQVDC